MGFEWVWGLIQPGFVRWAPPPLHETTLTTASTTSFHVFLQPIPLCLAPSTSKVINNDCNKIGACRQRLMLHSSVFMRKLRRERRLWKTTSVISARSAAGDDVCVWTASRSGYNWLRFDGRSTAYKIKIVSSPTLNTFKARLDKFRKNQDVRYHWKADILFTGSRTKVELIVD